MWAVREIGNSMWKKVVAPTALVSLFWIVVSCGTSYVLNRVDDSQTTLLYQNRDVIQAAGGMQENLWRLQAALLEAAELLEEGVVPREKVEPEMRRVEAAFQAALGRAAENASTADEKSLVAAIARGFDEYRAFSHQQLSLGGRSPAAAASSIEAAMRLARGVARPCEELSQLAQQLTTDALERRDRLRRRVDAARIGFIIIGPALGIWLGVWVARGLHQSISQISVTLRTASGDLEQHVGLVEVRPASELDGLPALEEQVRAVSGRIKQVLEELQRTRREALRAERLAAVGELAAGVAHEMRNPLTSIKLLIQAVRRNQTHASPDAERLHVVEQEIARMETTIKELLDFAKPPKIRRVRHDVRDTLRRALTLVDGRARQARVVIHERLGAKPVIVDADPDQLDQVFVNLLLNAIEAMSEGGELDLTVEGESPNSSAPLRIVFRDSGTGIPATVMPRLFEPFVTSKDRGIGLGLAISRGIMQEHGGQLTASNAPPAGAMFVVELPLAQCAGDGSTRETRWKETVS